jgi:hypothetical protein
MWRYRVENDNAGKPRWWLHSGTRDEAFSGEAFSGEWEARRAAQTFKAEAAICTYDKFQGENGRWYWHAQARNGRIVAFSGRPFDTVLEATASAEMVRINAGSAVLP